MLKHVIAKHAVASAVGALLVLAAPAAATAQDAAAPTAAHVEAAPHGGGSTAAAHGNAAPAGTERGDMLPQFNPENFAPQIFWMLVTFGALWLLMGKIALPRVTDVLEERERRVSNDLDKAEQLRQEAEEIRQAYESSLTEARSKARARLAKVESEITDHAAEREAEFNANVTERLREAEDRIARTQDEVMGNLRDMARPVASAAMNKVVGITPAQDELDAALDTVLREAS